MCKQNLLKSLCFASVNYKIQYEIKYLGRRILNKLFVTRTCFVRLMLFKHHGERTEYVFKQLKILPIKNLFIFKVLRSCYKMSGNRGTDNLHYFTRSAPQRNVSKRRVNKSFLRDISFPWVQNVKRCYQMILKEEFDIVHRQHGSALL